MNNGKIIITFVAGVWILAGITSSGRAGERPSPRPAGVSKGQKGDTVSESSKKTTGFVSDDVYLAHRPSAGHPERPERLTAIVNGLKKSGLMEKVEKIPVAPADVKWIELIHSPGYVKRVKKACEGGKRMIDTPDVSVSEKSYDVALAAVGGVLAAGDSVAAGKIKNAFCAVRPPGHHALPDKAMGFCLFNNAAILARYLQKKHGFKKILIIDWDVHHGNGTQDVFTSDPSVMYFSTHQFPFYPGTGRESEKGEGDGKGTIVNVPITAGAGDEEIVKAFREKLVPAADSFKPDFVVISAGFDAHAKDPLGGFKVTADGFAELTRIVKGIADKHAQGRLVSILEGGYSLEALSESVNAHVSELMKSQKR